MILDLLTSFNDKADAMVLLHVLAQCRQDIAAANENEEVAISEGNERIPNFHRIARASKKRRNSSYRWIKTANENEEVAISEGIIHIQGE